MGDTKLRDISQNESANGSETNTELKSRCSKRMWRSVTPAHPGGHQRSEQGSPEENGDAQLPREKELPKTTLHRPASSINYQPPNLNTLKKASSYRLSTTSGTRMEMSRVVQLVQRKRKKNRSALLTPSSDEDQDDTTRDGCSTSLTVLSVDTLDERQGEGDPLAEDPGSTGRPQDSGTRATNRYLRACERCGTPPVRTVLKKMGSQRINLNHHAMGPAGVKALCVALVNNVSMETLELAGNDLGPEGIIHIQALMEENNYITELNLAENGLGSAGLQVVTEFVRDHPFLITLNISGNGFSEEDAGYVAKILQENQALKELNISHNSFRERGGQLIAPALAKNDTLESLDLSWNHLRRKGAIAICGGIRINQSLLRVNLAWNGFFLEGCKALAPVLVENSTLQELDLTSNRINRSCLEHITKGMRQNTALQCIRLGNNPLTSEGAFKLLQTIYQCETTLPLKVLDISGVAVEKRFVDLVTEMQETRTVHAHHGLVLDQMFLDLQGRTDHFLHEDPMMVLMEFMRIQNLRLVDLFTSLDKDGSKSLTRQELREGLLGVNIPMSPTMLNKLIDKLDVDGDGEVDFRKLLEGQKEHRRKLHVFKQRNKREETAWEQTEIGRINVLIKALLKLKAWKGKNSNQNNR